MGFTLGKTYLTLVSDCANLAIFNGVRAEERRPRMRPRTQNKIDLGWGRLLPQGEGQSKLWRWTLLWRDSGRKREVTIEAASDQEAMELAEKARKRPPGQGKRFDPDAVFLDMDRLTVEDALLKCMAGQDFREPGTRYNFKWAIEKFLEWHGNSFQYWDEMTLMHIQNYHDYLWSRDYALRTVKHCLEPIRKASRLFADNQGGKFKNFCAGLRISKRQQSYKCDTEEKSVWSIQRVMNFTDWLEQHPKWSHLAPGIALQGLAAFRLTEVIRLKPENVDHDAGVIKIEDRTKNKSSARIIPIASRILGLIDEYGLPAYKSYSGYSHSVTKAMREWDSSRAIPPKDLRKTIPTTAFDEGWDSDLLSRYMGHAVESVKAKHYQKISLERRLELYRECVVDRIEAAIGVHKEAVEKVIFLKEAK